MKFNMRLQSVLYWLEPIIYSLSIMVDNSIKKGGRQAYNQIREKLKVKIFKSNICRVLEHSAFQHKITDGTVTQLMSPGFEEQSFNRNLSVFETRYEITDKIGQGGNAVIKKCRQKQTGKIFAVKMSHMDRERMLQVKRIFKTVKALSNPHILKYKQLYLNLKQRNYYLVTQYLPFPTLRKFRSLPEPQLRSIVKQLLQILVYLHSNNLCHRDIKPDNILYDQQSQSIHLIDFGISKRYVLRGNRQDMWTPTGTLAYKAPEMFEGAGYSEGVDLWAAGITIYRLVAGREPFCEDYLIDMIEKIQTIDYQFGEEWTGYSRFLKDLVVRLLKHKSVRLTAAQALKHPWFLQQRPPSPQKNLSPFNRSPTTFNTPSDSQYGRLLSVRNHSILPVLESIEQLKISANDHDIFTN